VLVGTVGVAGAAGGFVSMTRLIDGPADDLLPAASATVALTDQLPSVNVWRSQLDTVADFVNEQVIIVPSSFLATIDTTSPSASPGSPNAGVASLVRLSEFDAPLSDAGNRSGATGEGAVVSIVKSRAPLAGDVFPAGSVTVPTTFHEPSVRVPSVHDETVAVKTYVQITVLPVGDVATTATVSPTTAPGIETSGVESDVMLSVFDVPESDAGSKSGVDGALGGVASIEMSRLGPAVETLPAGSATVADIDHVPSDIVGRSQLVTVDDAT
jgi:hypothetical protein